MTFKTLAWVMTFVLLSCHASAQEILTGFRSNTEKAATRRSVAPAHFLPFFDDFSQSDLYPDSTKWTDNSVLVPSRTSGACTPTVPKAKPSCTSSCAKAKTV